MELQEQVKFVEPVLIEEEALQQIQQLYTIREADVVKQFILDHSELIEVLIEAHDQVQRQFGPDQEIALEVVSDPEVEDLDELFAYVLTSRPAEEAQTRLNQLDEAWFLDQLDRVGGIFNLDLEFV
jgi:hypothetical protein